MDEDFISEFSNADLKDLRRNQRLGKVVAAMFNAPALAISAACGGWSETMAAYRLLNCEEVTPAALLVPHRQAVLERCAQHACVVVSQDTTELDYSHMKKTKGLGPLNDESRRGLFMHSLYVVSEEGLPLGLLDTEMMIRDDETFRRAAERRHLPIEEKESFRWVEGYRKTVELARDLPGCEVFSISDREGDIFEVFEAWQLAAEEGPTAEWIIRANQDRALTGMVEGDPSKLFAALAQAPVLGEIEFKIRAKKGTKKVKGSTVQTSRTARTVCQTIRAMKITPRPPARKDRKLPEVSFWAVLAEETNPPAGEDPVRWVLLTSKEVTTLEEACRILNLYLRRWDIEVFHRVLKTGCRVERIQLKTAEALTCALVIYAVIAWRILYLTNIGRSCPDMLCSCVFEEEEWKAACAVVRRDKNAGEPTLCEFIAIIGKLGGHLGRKSDGPPGPQSIWQGLARVRDFALVWQIRDEE
jgi:hypothetical protein